MPTIWSYGYITAFIVASFSLLIHVGNRGDRDFAGLGRPLPKRVSALSKQDPHSSVQHFPRVCSDQFTAQQATRDLTYLLGIYTSTRYNN